MECLLRNTTITCTSTPCSRKTSEHYKLEAKSHVPFVVHTLSREKVLIQCDKQRYAIMTLSTSV